MNKEIYDSVNKNAHDLYLASPRLNPVDAVGIPVYTEYNICKRQAIGDLIKWALQQTNPNNYLINVLRTYDDITRYDIETSEKAFAECEAEHEEWKKKWGID